MKFKYSHYKYNNKKTKFEVKTHLRSVTDLQKAKKILADNQAAMEKTKEKFYEIVRSIDAIEAKINEMCDEIDVSIEYKNGEQHLSHTLR